MKNSKIIFTTIITLSIYVVSCSKKDTEKPSITINKPISTDTFSVYNDIKLDIDMSDNTDLAIPLLIDFGLARIVGPT